jgi:hypothetical protein
MRGPKPTPTHPVHLTVEDAKSFHQLLQAQSTLQAIALRARIMPRGTV